MRRFFGLITFVFAISFVTGVNAQDSSELSYGFEGYTSPSDRNLDLVEDVVLRCDILAEVVESIDGNEKSSQEIFDRLQQTDEDGNLLIDSPECESAILELVSSMCTADESTNNVYCKSLVLQKLKMPVIPTMISTNEITTKTLVPVY